MEVSLVDVEGAIADRLYQIQAVFDDEDGLTLSGSLFEQVE